MIIPMTTNIFLLSLIMRFQLIVNNLCTANITKTLAKNIMRYFLFIFLISTSLISYSQTLDSSLQINPQLPDKYYSQVNRKISSVNDQLTKKSLKYLAKFQRQEQKLQQRLQKLHPELAIADATEKYTEISQKIKSKTSGITKIAGAYDPYLDSLSTSLNFLKQFNGISDKVKGPLNSFTQLQSKLQESEKIKAFIADRKNQIKELLSKYTHLPPGLKSEYVQLQKTEFYYQARLLEYKNILKDPDKMEKKALGILNQLPAFQKFMKQNSQLASLFRIPDNMGSSQSLTGLQTRSSVQALIQQRIASGGPNAQAQIQANLAEAQAEMGKLKDKLNQFTGGSDGGNIEMPDFEPNTQKTKSLLKRLEYSADMQFDKSNKLLPSGANIGLGIGYKLNDKSAFGVGVNYKIGMGTIQHISFTSQGLGLRSYMDWKIKKQIYVTGGYEMNYLTAIKNIQQLKNYDAWQRSALIGISKKYKVSKKVQGEMKILYDFLANAHVPVSQPVVFRLGYKF
jgi:hypothetical protein